MVVAALLAGKDLSPDRLAKIRKGKLGKAYTSNYERLPCVICGHQTDRVDNVTTMRILRSDYCGTGAMPQRGSFLLQNRWQLKREMQEVNS